MPGLMELGALPYHNIDPVLVWFGPVPIRWYSLAYIAGILLGWWYLARMARDDDAPYARRHADDFILWVTLGVILGGRIGYVLFYDPSRYFHDPGEILRLWDGGMSFHGGMLGTVVAILLFARKNKIDPFAFSDRIACVVPIGLFFGRIANFINGELWGRPSDLPWAMYFPDAGDQPRHPSQIYEALLEGVVLFLVLNFLLRRTDARKYPGLIVGCFFVGYGLSRIIAEFFREPDRHLGELFGFTTMGQILSLPMILFGAWLIYRGLRVGRAMLAAKSGHARS